MTYIGNTYKREQYPLWDGHMIDVDEPEDDLPLLGLIHPPTCEPVLRDEEHNYHEHNCAFSYVMDNVGLYDAFDVGKDGYPRDVPREPGVYPIGFVVEPCGWETLEWDTYLVGPA